LKKLILSIILFLLVVLAISTPFLSIVRASDETVSIQFANSSINQAFANVLRAEEAGGNVTTLLSKLNSAAALLAEADNAYNSGLLTNVTSYADNARLIADQVNGDSLTLLNSSIAESKNSFLSTMLFSTVAIALLVIALLLTWRRLKRAYTKKLLNLKPEIVENGV
jgi:hypothetical protein